MFCLCIQYVYTVYSSAKAFKGKRLIMKMPHLDDCAGFVRNSLFYWNQICAVSAIIPPSHAIQSQSKQYSRPRECRVDAWLRLWPDHLHALKGWFGRVCKRVLRSLLVLFFRSATVRCSTGRKGINAGSRERQKHTFVLQKDNRVIGPRIENWIIRISVTDG